MPIAKPTTVPDWVTDANAADPTKVDTPPGGLRDVGYAPGQRPAPMHFNWLIYWLCKWILWLNDITNQALTWAERHNFDKGLVATGASGSGDHGITTTGDGVGAGINATGGASGPGVNCSGTTGAICQGTTFGIDTSGPTGIRSYSIGANPSVRCMSDGTAGGGSVHLNGTRPLAANDPGKNHLHSTNVPKAFAFIELTPDGMGSYTIAFGDRFGIASAAVVNATTLSIAFHNNMNLGFYTVNYDRDSIAYKPCSSGKANTGFNIQLLDGTDTAIDLSTGASPRFVSFAVHGHCP
jgi:hypothetical protein